MREWTAFRAVGCPSPVGFDIYESKHSSRQCSRVINYNSRMMAASRRDSTRHLAPFEHDFTIATDFALRPPRRTYAAHFPRRDSRNDTLVRMFFERKMQPNCFVSRETVVIKRHASLGRDFRVWKKVPVVKDVEIDLKYQKQLCRVFQLFSKMEN